MNATQVVVLVLVAIFCVFLGYSSAVELPDITPETSLTDIVEYHLKDGLHEILPKEDRDLFYEQYEDNYDGLSGLNLVALLDMFAKPVADNKTCQMCNSIMTLGRTVIKSKEIVVGLLGGLCKDSDSLSRRACLGLLERNADPVVWLFANTKLQNAELCSVLAGHGCLKYLNYEDNKKIFWELPLPAKKEFKPLAPTSTKNKKILHLTDIHLDLWYTPGSPSSCNEPLCCRSTSFDAKGKNHTTGYWAEVNGTCDSPQHFVLDSLKHIAKAHPDLDAIFWTGDNVPHDVWNTTQEINLRHIHTVTGIISVAFNNVPVFPVLGNHEAHPINLYVPQAVTQLSNGSFNMKWLYEPLINEYWTKWIDTAEAKKSFLQSGFYSKMFQPNWKVIVLNSNIPQKMNFWALYDPMDPDGHLEWLIKELDHAESIGAYVTVLGHIPPKFEIYDAWLHNYIRIVDRYAHLITAGFFGHTHDDEVVVLYNQAKKPIGINYISGSLTTFSYLNPQYTIFEMDPRGYPVASSTYLTYIDEANQRYQKNTTVSPVWKLEYHPRKSYQMPDLSPASWDKFITEAKTDMDLAYLYSGHYHRHSTEFLVENPINNTVLLQMLKDAQRFDPFMPVEEDKEN